MGQGLKRFFRLVASGIGAFCLAGAPSILEIQPREMRIFEKQGKKRAVVRFVRSVLEKDYYVFEKPEGEFFLREGKLLFSAKKGRYFPEKQVLILEDSVSCRMPFENLQWETEEMEIVMDKKEIRGKKGIHFQWGTMEVAGREWEMKVEEKRVVLSGGVKGIIAEKGGY